MKAQKNRLEIYLSVDSDYPCREDGPPMTP